MARAQAGDVDAFAELYGTYREVIFRFLYRRSQDRALAEDLTQDVFVRALRSLGRWTYQGKDVGAWLVTIARNLLVDHHKAGEQRFTTTVDHMDFGAHLTDRSREGNPESTVIAQLRDTALLKALWRLTEEQRTCLVHRYVQGLSLAETADVMGKPESAIKALAYRGVQAMTAQITYQEWR